MAKGSDNPFPSVLLVEQSSTPTSPASGDQRLFLKTSDHLAYTVNSAGAVAAVGGSSSYQWTAKTANYTLVAGDFIAADATSGALTMTLPTAVGVTALLAVAKVESSANKVTIATTSGQTIGGVTTKTLSLQHDVLLLASDGANWTIVAAHLGDVLQLDYAASTDIASGVVTSTTYVDIGTNQSFTVDDASSLVEISVGGSIGVGTAVASGSRIMVDSAGTPITKVVGGTTTQGAGIYGNALSGSGMISLSGLATGTHTVKVQVLSSAAGTAYCRASTQVNFESLQIRVWERKR